MNAHLRSNLSPVLSTANLAAISESFSFISKLPDDQQLQVRTAFAEGYNKQMQMMAASAARHCWHQCLFGKDDPERSHSIPHLCTPCSAQSNLPRQPHQISPPRVSSAMYKPSSLARLRQRPPICVYFLLGVSKTCRDPFCRCHTGFSPS